MVRTVLSFEDYFLFHLTFSDLMNQVSLTEAEDFTTALKSSYVRKLMIYSFQLEGTSLFKSNVLSDDKAKSQDQA